ncbi:MAG: VF530 family protein [Bacteroidota bacterium]
MNKGNKEEQPNNPLHGMTLEMVLEYLWGVYGWEELEKEINIRCFKHEPSIKSCLIFLRKTPWAREKVEQLYLETRYQ